MAVGPVALRKRGMTMSAPLLPRLLTGSTSDPRTRVTSKGSQRMCGLEERHLIDKRTRLSITMSFIFLK